MRKELIELVKNSIVFQYPLPNNKNDIERSAFSTQKDVCFFNDDSTDISKTIYNSIVEYAKNEYEIDYDNLTVEQLKALKLSLRYEEDATDETKQKYGFFGEVLLYAILSVHMGADVLISKGYFYSPVERSEAKGYDVFHLIERKNNLELWFGESKLYVDFKPAINKIIEGLSKAISDTYFERNIFAIIKEKSHFTSSPSKLLDVIDSWEKNPDINLSQEIKEKNIKLVYPMFVAYDKKVKTYDDAIKDCIKHIKEKFDEYAEVLSPTFEFSLFFILLPLDNVSQIKKDVINWITEKKPLI